MVKQKIILSILAILCLAQIYVPASMIIDQETTINSGELFKFECRPVDPTDPFRGKYVTLNFQATSVIIDEKDEYNRDELVFVSVETAGDGFARIADIDREEPVGFDHYFKANVAWTTWERSRKAVEMRLPFDRFYMEESKAPRAEQLYGEQLRDSTNTVYGLVSVYRGNAVLRDVLVNGVSLQDAIDVEE